MIIFPDGREQEIERRGLPSILEDKKVLIKGTRLGVQSLVVELMSLHPECIFAESVQMIRPNILVITNVRLDHLAQMGSSKVEIAQSLASSIPPQCTVFIPQEECYPVFKEIGENLNSKIVQVSRDLCKEFLQSGELKAPHEFEENLRLAMSVGEFLGIKKEQVLQGVEKAQPDFGSLKVWKAEFGSPPQSFYFISAFAANDPESTLKVLSKVKDRIPFEGKRIIGLLNLRNDRGDRTIQWQKALNKGYFQLFCRIVLVGGHAHALKRRLKLSTQIALSIIKEKSPQKIMARLSLLEQEEVVLVGMGNMGGAAQELVTYWERIGRPYDF